MLHVPTSRPDGAGCRGRLGGGGGGRWWGRVIVLFWRRVGGVIVLFSERQRQRQRDRERDKKKGCTSGGVYVPCMYYTHAR